MSNDKKDIDNLNLNNRNESKQEPEPLTLLWTRLCGSAKNDYSKAITIANDGSIYITGITYGDLDGHTNLGSNDAFLTKYSSNGSKQWTRLLGTSENDHSMGIATANDGSIYITGYTYGNLDDQTNSGDRDAFLTKYSSDGNKDWTILLGTSENDASYGIATANDGSIYITGLTFANLDDQTNSGISDAFLTKYSSDGAKQWTRLSGSSGDDNSNGIAVANDGSIYITGNTYGGTGNSGGRDSFLTKCDEAGTEQWTRLLGSSGYEFVRIATANDGSIYITGYTYSDFDGQSNSGESDSFLTKYSSDGAKEWTRLLGGQMMDYSYGVETANDGSIYITGYTYSDFDGQSNSGESDSFLTKYSSDGTKQWTRLLGSSEYEHSMGIAIANDGIIYIIGDTNSNLDEQTNSGKYDVFYQNI